MVRAARRGIPDVRACTCVRNFPPAAMSPEQPTRIRRLTAVIAVVAVLGIPLAAYLWTTLNDLMSGKVRAGQLLIAMPVLVAFVLLLVAWARVVRRTEAAPEEGSALPPRGS
jgi:Na+/melibiose symporter-like transporter